MEVPTKGLLELDWIHELPAEDHYGWFFFVWKLWLSVQGGCFFVFSSYARSPKKETLKPLPAIQQLGLVNQQGSL